MKNKILAGFLILAYLANFVGILVSWTSGDVEMNRYYNMMTLLTIILTFLICNENN